VKEGRAKVRKLLEDENAGVRRRVALALLEARDREAVPALVALTGCDSSEDSEAAEDALAGLAGDKAPEPVPPSDLKAREKTRAAWEKWWKEAGPKVDLAKADLNAGVRGMSVLGVMDIRTGMTKLIVADARGEKKFTVDPGVRNPTYASACRRDRVLVADVNGGRVVEMDRTGKGHWEMRVTQPLYVSRLRDGRVFIASRRELLVLDRARNVSKRVTRAAPDVASAHIFDDGTFGVLTTNGRVLRLDADGKEKASHNVGRFFSVFGLKAHFAADGGFVVPDYSGSMVRSYDRDGKIRWETRVTRPSSVTALPGGGYLVTQRLSNSTTELDKDGKMVRTKAVPEGRPLFFDRR
jgi:hypothetical protein